MFEPRNEEQLEDWVDNAARFVNDVKLPPSLFQELWESRASRALASIVAKAPNEDYEQIVDYVALGMFSSSDYPARLEESLMQPPRHVTVIEARVWMSERLARYKRVSARRGWKSPLSDDRVRECLLRSLPRELEGKVRDKEPKTCVEIIKNATFLESRCCPNVELEAAISREEEMERNAENARSQRQQKKREMRQLTVLVIAVAAVVAAVVAVLPLSVLLVVAVLVVAVLVATGSLPAALCCLSVLS
eukprot:GHVS01051870.1.p1 GENE.GHVS01051870.1~~GHVS01051870.1.p1  ORF type:complete len:271 (-),score=39.03 GHVS01051870.1:142-885(-)